MNDDLTAHLNGSSEQRPRIQELTMMARYVCQRHSCVAGESTN